MRKVSLLVGAASLAAAHLACGGSPSYPTTPATPVPIPTPTPTPPIGFGIPPESYLGTFQVLVGLEQPEDVLISAEDEEVDLPAHVSLMPANRKLEKVEQALLSQNKFIVLQDVLIKPLKRLKPLFDYIFLDTAPNAMALGSCTTSERTRVTQPYSWSVAIRVGARTGSVAPARCTPAVSARTVAPTSAPAGG